MDIVSRIWPREAGSSALDLSLAERLKQLTEQIPPDQTEEEPNATASLAAGESAPGAAKDASAIALAEAKTGAEAASTDDRQPAEHQNDSVEAGGANSNGDAHTGSPAGGQPKVSPKEEPVVPAPEQRPAAATDPQDKAPDNSMASPEATKPPAGPGRKFFRAPKWGSKPQEPAQAQTPPTESSQSEAQNPVVQQTEIPQTGAQQADGQQAKDEQAQNPPERSQLAPAFPVPNQEFLDQFKAAVDRAESTGESTLASVQQAMMELQSAKLEFETEIRDRLDEALAEYERRLATETLVEDAAGQLEQRTRQATDKIFHEVKEQAWVMLNAVAGELRSFRDQFGKEVRDRVGLLDEATQQALQVKENLEATLPEAKDIHQSLPLAGQEAAARVEAASAAVTEQLQGSRDALSEEIAAQKEALKALLRDCHQDELLLKEEIEKFRAEAETACDLLGRKADEALDRVRAGTDEAGARAREGIENLSAEVEQQLLSGELIEKATGKVEEAAQQVIDPALERIRNAGAEADSIADSLTQTGDDVVGRLGTARQEIEARLDTLLTEQRNMLESSMNGFHRKAAEELGNVVERVVAQSSQELDERLRFLFDDLLSSTSEQINGTARATLSSLHDGLKGVFEPEAREAAAGSGENSGGE